MENLSEKYAQCLLTAMDLEKTQRYDEAIESYKQALVINPDADYLYKKLADLNYFVKNNPLDTIIYLEKFLEYQPENSDAKGCLGLAYLKTKNYEKGWEYFDHRLYKKNEIIKHKKTGGKPIWKGEDLKNKTIYVYSEAGFGDTIMTARFLKPLKNKCKKVFFEPERACTELYKQSMPDIQILNDEEKDIPDFDYHVPIMSLPYLLGIKTEEEISSLDEYLKADSKKVQEYKRYFQNDKFKIGIKWFGKGDSSEEILSKQIPLTYFYKLFELSDTKFYSLQKGFGEEQLQEKMAKEFAITDLGPTFKDFADTAAAIENLDLLICNDTSVAHLAGAMGKPCWVLLPFDQDWRWSMDVSYCLWYKSVKLFRQENTGDWDEVFDRVLTELKNIV